ncbi:sodium- and chloride-dependent glycine transporter 1-like [Anneissia japonica]|uniref:sodium- and chloride-dependent glycine transporter 1-like n=1 Tax=Anneissia japonica TaxID=1529436 RepID=UPI00142562E7|nr:sodium- and chloride-dependent glycine transporter 1-like [Anneissia japonica]
MKKNKMEEMEIEDSEAVVNRGQWGSHIEFLLSCIGYAVGLGNVWRFPYLCYANGGGAFLIPYLIMLICAGLPLFFMEMAFGQFASLGTISAWSISPLFRGVGIGMIVVSGLVGIYYNVIIAWTIYYMIQSCTTGDLPWVGCNNTWNTPDCYPAGQNISGLEGNYIRASDEYWHHYVHNITSGIDEVGGLKWDLVGCLFASWVVIFLCLLKGVKSSGKVVYFTATFPYIILTVLFFRGVTLDGAGDGIEFYIVPDVDILATSKPWKDAAIQIFYSLGVSFGGLMTMASFNNFNNNCFRDALVVAFTNCGTSVFAGFVIFSVLGFMSKTSGIPIEDVVADGPGLAFIVYPEALSLLPGSQVWAFLFFFMLFTLGLDSEFAMMETVISAIYDILPQERRKFKPLLTFVCCIIGFVLGLPCVTRGGLYVFQLMDWYSAGFSLMVIAIVFCCVISYQYGTNRFLDDIEAMVGFRPRIYWKACWMVVTPVLLVAIIVFTFVYYTPVTYNDYKYPAWAEVVGWILSCTSFVVIPIYAVFAISREEGPILDRIKLLLKPTDDWGPALNVNRIKAGYQPIGAGLESVSEKVNPRYNVNEGFMA